MKAIIFASFGEYLADHGWQLFGAAFLVSITLAIHDHSDLSHTIKTSSGLEQAKARRRRILNWLLVIASLFAAIGSQVGSEIADKKIKTASDKLLTLEAANSLLKSNIFHLETRIIRTGNRSRMLFEARPNFESALKGQPTGELTVWYMPNDKEAYMFGRTIAVFATWNSWYVSGLTPIPDNWTSPHFRNLRHDDPFLANWPLALKVTSTLRGLSVFSTSSNVLASVLTNAFVNSGFDTVDWQPDESLPTNKIRIVITQNEL